ncbi:MAG: hypothetical protein HQL59_13790, partial [Magnetococcales bacterium]|nr:hypothetical protein [Magnetococcales bacterium]
MVGWVMVDPAFPGVRGRRRPLLRWVGVALVVGVAWGAAGGLLAEDGVGEAGKIAEERWSAPGGKPGDAGALAGDPHGDDLAELPLERPVGAYGAPGGGSSSSGGIGQTEVREEPLSGLGEGSSLLSPSAVRKLLERGAPGVALRLAEAALERGGAPLEVPQWLGLRVRALMALGEFARAGRVLADRGEEGMGEDA